MSKKVIAAKANVEKFFGPLEPYQRRFCLKFSKYVAAGYKVIDFGEADYKGHDAARGLVRSADPFLHMLEQDHLIKLVPNGHKSRKILVNVDVDYRESVLGFEMIPDCFLESDFAQASEKVCDIIGVCFFCAKKRKNLNSVARTYHFRVYGREVQKILHWPNDVNSSIKTSLHKAVKKINRYTPQTGISVNLIEPQGPYVRMERYLNEMYFEFCFEPEFAKKYLAKFNMKPVNHSEAPEIIPESAVEPQQLNFISNEFEGMNHEEIATVLEKIALALRSEKRKVAQA